MITIGRLGKREEKEEGRTGPKIGRDWELKGTCHKILLL